MSNSSLSVEQVATALGLTSDELAKMVADVKKKRVEDAQTKVSLFRFIASQPKVIGPARLYPSLSDARSSGAVQSTPDGVVIGGIKLDQDAGMAILQTWERYEAELECAQEDLDPSWKELPSASIRRPEGEQRLQALEPETLSVAQSLQGVLAVEASRAKTTEAKNAKESETRGAMEKETQRAPSRDQISALVEADQRRKKRLGFTE